MHIKKFRILVSIVNYRASDLICEMLPNLINEINLEKDFVTIFDNNSCDGSLLKLEKFIKKNDLEKNVLLLQSDINGGFSFGNNRIVENTIKHLGKAPEFVYLLNPDAIPQKNSVKELVNFLSTHQSAGIVGSRLESIHGIIQTSSFRFHSFSTELLSSLSVGYLDKLFRNYTLINMLDTFQTRETEWIAGASMMIRYELYKYLGGMDEEYFLYFEETDFCLQAKRAGWQCWHIQSSHVIHYEGQSTGVVSSDIHKRRRPKYWFNSRQRYFLKNYGLIYTAMTDFAWIIGYFTYRTRAMIQGKETNSPPHMMLDFLKNSIFLSWFYK